MVTKEEALTVYNARNGTEYETVAALGLALVRHALRTSWIEHKKREAYILAETETERL